MTNAGYYDKAKLEVLGVS